ncbi:hypothetical protein NDU88_009478, partial [Pleurodeles waltl]
SASFLHTQQILHRQQCKLPSHTEQIQYRQQWCKLPRRTANTAHKECKLHSHAEQIQHRQHYSASFPQTQSRYSTGSSSASFPHTQQIQHTQQCMLPHREGTMQASLIHTDIAQEQYKLPSHTADTA